MKCKCNRRCAYVTCPHKHIHERRDTCDILCYNYGKGISCKNINNRPPKRKSKKRTVTVKGWARRSLTGFIWADNANINKGAPCTIHFKAEDWEKLK